MALYTLILSDKAHKQCLLQKAVFVICYCFNVLCRLELQCVIAVMRHGDRTPKQKMKMVVTHQRYA